MNDDELCSANCNHPCASLIHVVPPFTPVREKAHVWAPLHVELQCESTLMFSIPVTLVSDLTWVFNTFKAILFWPGEALQPIWPFDMFPERKDACIEKTGALSHAVACGFECL